MTIAPIELKVDTAAGTAIAWQAITDPDRIALWFTDASPIGPVGSAYRLDFGDGSVVVGEIVLLEPGRRFAYTWAWEGADESTATRVTWTVEARPGGGSQIRLVHDGWPDDAARERDDHEAYWSGYLDDLRDVLGAT